jgi:hypothetical protein
VKGGVPERRLSPILDVHRFEIREGDLLEHQAGGSIWKVMEIVGGPHGDMRGECVVEGSGSKLGRVDVFHGEYTARSFALVPRAALLAIEAAIRERLLSVDWQAVNADAEQRCPSREHRPFGCAQCVVEAALDTQEIGGTDVG